MISKLRNLPWSNIARNSSAGAFGFMLLGLMAFFNSSSFLGMTLTFVAPALSILLIVAWFVSAALTLAFEDQGKKKLIPSLGFVLLFSLVMGSYFFLFYAISGVDAEASRRHSHHHRAVSHEKSGVPPSEAEKTASSRRAQ